MGGKNAPAAPDFGAAAQQQAESSKQVTGAQTLANRPTQTNVFGATTRWTQNPDGSWAQTSNLGGGLDVAAARLQNQLANQGALGTGEDARRQAIEASRRSFTSMLDPQWQQKRAQTQAQLAAQGLDPSSAAYQSEMGNLGRSEQQAYQNAMDQAISGANQAQSLTFQQNLAAQNAPLQQLAALGGLGQQSSVPMAGSAQPLQQLAALSAQYGGELQQYGADQAAKNSLLGGIANTGTTGLSFAALSDERLKNRIERYQVAAIPGVPLASWEWHDEPGVRHYGVIAQDVEMVRPDLVSRDANGYRMVDYSFLLGGK